MGPMGRATTAAPATTAGPVTTAPLIAAAITTRIEGTIGVVWAWQSLSQTGPTQRPSQCVQECGRSESRSRSRVHRHRWMLLHFNRDEQQIAEAMRDTASLQS